MLFFSLLTSIVNLVWLAKGEFPEKKPWESAVDAALNFFLAMWVVILLGSTP